MLLQIATLTLLVLCEVKCDFVSESRWRDIKNGSINNVEEYCEHKNCIVKCCPDGHVVVKRKTNGIANFTCYPSRVDYSKFNEFISWNVALSKSNVSHFHFIQNDQLADLNKDIPPYSNSKFDLLEVSF